MGYGAPMLELTAAWAGIAGIALAFVADATGKRWLWKLSFGLMAASLCVLAVPNMGNF